MKFWKLFQPNEYQIRTNKNGLIFPVLTGFSKDNYYIQNYTGKMFELFIRNIFEQREKLSKHLQEKLNISVPDYDVFAYETKETQIDLIIESKLDRLSRIIKCKWGKWDNKFIEEVQSKSYQLKSSYSRLNYIFISEEVSVSTKSKASNKGVHIITLKDLYR